MRLFRATFFLGCFLVAIAAACSSFNGETPTADAGASSDAPLADATVDSAVAEDAEAGPRDAGADVRTHRYVFVTAGTRRSDLGPGADSGVGEADKFCQNEALRAGIGGLKWRAFLGHAPDLDPRDRIADAGTIPHDYKLLDGRLVFRKDYALPASGPLLPDNPITTDQFGADASDLQVWTGAELTGKAHPSVLHCNRWTSATGEGMTGWTSYSLTPGDLSQWISATAGATLDRACTSTHHIYCFEVDP